jgi:hypothetical protein
MQKESPRTKQISLHNICMYVNDLLLLLLLLAVEVGLFIYTRQRFTMAYYISVA